MENPEYLRGVRAAEDVCRRLADKESMSSALNLVRWNAFDDCCLHIRMELLRPEVSE